MRRPGIRGAVTQAALVVALPAVIAACGQQPTGASSPAAPSQAASAAAATPATTPTPSATESCSRPATPVSNGTLTVSTGDNGTTLCVTTGTAVLVFLPGSAASRWAPVRVSSADLAPHPDPAFTLALWVTGASFLAVHSGTVLVTSSRPACGQGSPSGESVATPGANCPSVTVAFRVTLVITR